MRAEVRETKHKVTRSIKSLYEIDEFLNATSKFGKKHYKVGTVHHEMKTWLSIAAIGISRDLVYVITWQPEAEALPDSVEPDAVHAGDSPIKGWVPIDEKALKKLYPNHGEVPDEVGEHHWITIFTTHGFLICDTIEEL